MLDSLSPDMPATIHYLSDWMRAAKADQTTRPQATRPKRNRRSRARRTGWIMMGFGLMLGMFVHCILLLHA